MDYLDFLNGTGTQTYKGIYFKKTYAPLGIDQAPTAYADQKPVLFFYEPIDETRQYKQPTENLVDRKAIDATIKTKNRIFNFLSSKLEGFVLLQDGNFYEILSSGIDRKGVSKQAAEYIPVPVGADFIVRLAKIDNPFQTFDVQDILHPVIRPQGHSVSWEVGEGIYVIGDITSPTETNEIFAISFTSLEEISVTKTGECNMHKLSYTRDGEITTTVVLDGIAGDVEITAWIEDE